MNTTQDKILTKREVAALLRLRSTTSIDDMIRAGEFIPGFRRGLRRVGWFESEVNAWLAARVDERNALMAEIATKNQRKAAIN
ncbi:AlpA family phage regulatory protein [Salmonella enterica]|nr:AlpA family phage regulatory protein [Salmonella enterica subsp. enterica serovar Infantis]EAP3038286.1 AlpA family phage regulatory protein [Salmonella enterica]EAP4146796.1 AlpA family phage regulatory protein [Salmonella enterica subsp. enterica serovar Anatum]ECI0123661.1 AlpA family phage regulatory protein [Salmonella enterica subsp. enterica serovar Abaetetuba]EGR7199665.1 AlpA family phage regulatory protein [Salmonella enterica subsp. enterica serovar Muenchen]EHM5650419.1 AlpA fam